MMRSRARIRFSKHCLISHGVLEPELGERPVDINFRLIRESHTAVRDARMYVEARFKLPKWAQEGSMGQSKRLSASGMNAGMTDVMRAELEVAPPTIPRMSPACETPSRERPTRAARSR